MHNVLVLDDIDDVLMEASFRTEHFVEMCNRGWIKSNRWIRHGVTVDVIRYQMLIKFFAESAS